MEARPGFLYEGWGCAPLLAIGFQASSSGRQGSFNAGGQQGRGHAVCCYPAVIFLSIRSRFPSKRKAPEAGRAG